MEKNRPSVTALGIAMARAIESEKPEGERICYDPFARKFIPTWFWYAFKFFVTSGYNERRRPGMMGFLMARDRYIDDYLAACLQEGLDQLVILGAGYDARAYRFEKIKEGVKVFEVDHPATQQAKIDQLRKILGELPGYVVFTPVDFSKETLEEQLIANGFQSDLKTLFIWQGVIHYLEPQDVDKTLEFVANRSGPGNSIIFDYMYTLLLDGTV